jgi:hypothetical protein
MDRVNSNPAEIIQRVQKMPKGWGQPQIRERCATIRVFLAFDRVPTNPKSLLASSLLSEVDMEAGKAHDQARTAAEHA